MKNLMLLTICTASLLLGVSCEQEPEPTPIPPVEEGMRHEGLAIIETGDTRIPYMINHEDGMEIAVIDEFGNEEYRSIIMSDGYEDPLLIRFDEQSRITELVTSDKIYVFDNYESGETDIAEIDENGEISIWRDVQLSGIAAEHEEVVPRGFSALIRALQDVGYVGNLISCAGSLTTVLGALIPCSTALMATLDRLDLEDQIPLLNSAIEYFETVGFVDGAIQCGVNRDLDNCIELAFSVAESTASFLQGILEDNSLNVELARGALISGDGEIKITLQWDAPVDLDLYVTDPSGETISYQNKTSSNGGTLDVDDTDGFGPENVFYTSVQNGFYSVAVDYYSGVQATVFKVRVQQAGYAKIYTGVLQIEGDNMTVVTFKFGEPLPLWDEVDVTDNNANIQTLKPSKNLD